MKNLKVKDLMSKPAIYVHCSETIVDCCKLMNKYSVSFLPVVNKYSTIIGTVTEHDIIQNIINCEKDIYCSVLQAMNTKVITCNKNDDLSIAVSKMADNQTTHIIAIEKNTIKGVLSLSDLTKHKDSLIYIPELLKEINNNYRQSSDKPLFKDISEPKKI